MPPRGDTREGPVVRSAMKALEISHLNYVLIRVFEESERELKGIFRKTLKAGKGGTGMQDVADEWFFLNTIPLHRAGEGAPYTGMKPAGFSEGPVVPGAEKAIETGDPKETILMTVKDDLVSWIIMSWRRKKGK